MANIAQMVNVLQAMILTDKEKMVLTPTYHVLQDVCAVPGRHVRARHLPGGHLHSRRGHLARVDAIAAKDAAGKLWLAVTNIDPNQPVTIEAALAGVTPKSAAGVTLTAPKVDSVNTFEAPNTVVPKPIGAKVQGHTLALTLAPKSVTVIAVEQ